MATRTYVTCRSPGTRLRGAPYGNWSPGDSDRDNRGLKKFTFLLALSNVDGGVLTQVSSGASRTKANGQLLLMANGNGTAIWVTDPVAADVTLSGTATIMLQVSTGAGGALAAYHVYAYVAVGDSLVRRAVLIDNVTDATNPFNGVHQFRGATFALSGAVAQAGDRIVFEIGAACSPDTAPPGDNEYFTSWGTTNAADAVLADATEGELNPRAAWLEFSATVTFVGPPAAPANDACVDAEVIAALPFQIGPIDTTASADTARSIWYTWTAPANMRVFATTWGGNYYTRVNAWRNGCGSLFFVASEFRVPWVGTSQASIFFDAVAGTQYWFEIESARDTVSNAAQFGAKNSGGAAYFALFPYVAPGDGDLFVDCQHIVCYHAGQAAIVQSGFYGSTPTNSVIDYSLRPMDDFNGGVNTTRRLNVGLFGTTPLVEILELDTLNVGESEIDFIDDPLNYVGHSENLASIIIDATGRLLLGYFGDNYSVIGGLSTPNQCRVNRIDATHADFQAGAPWADAEAFTVDQDVEGSDYIDLAVDQTTLFYTSAGRLVKRYDLATATQLADFATLPVQGGGVPRPGARGVRLLFPYDGTGGALVAYGNCVHRIDAAGTVIQTYTPVETELAQDLDKVEIDFDAVTFWVSDQFSTTLFQFNIETGAQLATLETELPPGQLSGFTILGYRATPPPPPPPPPPGGSGTIIVVKDIVPNGDPTIFDFTAGGGLSPTSFSLGDGDDFTYLTVPAGSGYTVAETPHPLFTTQAVVSNGSPISNLSVANGETVIVTFTNTRTTPPPPTPGQPGCPIEFPVEASADHACAPVWTP